MSSVLLYYSAVYVAWHGMLKTHPVAHSHCRYLHGPCRSIPAGSDHHQSEAFVSVTSPTETTLIPTSHSQNRKIGKSLLSSGAHSNGANGPLKTAGECGPSSPSRHDEAPFFPLPQLKPWPRGRQIGLDAVSRKRGKNRKGRDGSRL
jgi:hypothetical protein